MADAGYKPRMKGIYDDTIVKAMTDKFGYKNALEVPRIEKIVLNMGVGEATQDKKKVDQAASEMELIAGWIDAGVEAAKSEDEAALERIAGEVRELAAAFPIPV